MGRRLYLAIRANKTNAFCTDERSLSHDHYCHWQQESLEKSTHKRLSMCFEF
ncbi:Uncharacterised protein [Vibrio cholerae]|nr:Uncharacterised protein [Vibrio cholerae]